MIKYNVRSRQLIDIVNDIKSLRIIISPHFQRNLVWRDIHKVDFIKTILLGLPFPQIFIASGDIDIEEMITTSAIVDGQQRLNSIVGYIDGDFSVDGKAYFDLDFKEKEEFLKYEIAIIELDIKHDDPQIKEIFKRLNRTYYSLSSVEKMSTEFAASEFMLVAKLLTKEISFDTTTLEKENIFVLKYDPNIPPSFFDWANDKDVNNYTKLMLELGVFSTFDISRQVHLNFTLNILGTISEGSFFNRNLKDDIIESNSNEFLIKNDIVDKLDKISDIIIKLKFKKNSYWLNKANLFSIIIAFYNNFDILEKAQIKKIKMLFDEFEINLDETYKIYAKEGVNNKKERIFRDTKIVENIIKKLD